MRLVKVKKGSLLSVENMLDRQIDPIVNSAYAKSLLCNYLSEFIIENTNKHHTRSSKFIDDIVVNPEKIMLDLLNTAYETNNC